MLPSYVAIKNNSIVCPKINLIGKTVSRQKSTGSGSGVVNHDGQCNENICYLPWLLIL